jgi:NADH dehydrogenase
MELGTVVVTGANGQVGRRLLSALPGHCHRIIALVRQPIDLPATEVISDWMNSAKARETIAHADAVLHLSGTLRPRQGDYVSANIKPTEVLVSALTNQTKRLVFLSYVGASDQSSNAYLSTKAKAEHLLQASGVPLTVFRCSHIIGSPDRPGTMAENLLSQNGKVVTVLGCGHQMVAPIYLDDVVTAILAALQQQHDGVFNLVGPESLAIDDLVNLLNPKDTVKVTHLPPLVAKLLPWVVRDLPAALVDVMLRESVGDPQRVVATFDLTLTPLKQVWSSN